MRYLFTLRHLGLLALLVAPLLTRAQGGVGIGTTAHNASAALDIVSSSKGVLLPRMASTSAHTATQPLNLQRNALTGTGDNIGSTMGMGARANGGLNLGQNTTGGSIDLGYLAGQTNTTGSYDTFSGTASGPSNTSGNNNAFNGTGSSGNNTMGGNNAFSGQQSDYYNTAGSSNTALCYSSGPANGSDAFTNTLALRRRLPRPRPTTPTC